MTSTLPVLRDFVHGQLDNYRKFQRQLDTLYIEEVRSEVQDNIEELYNLQQEFESLKIQSPFMQYEAVGDKEFSQEEFFKIVRKEQEMSKKIQKDIEEAMEFMEDLDNIPTGQIAEYVSENKKNFDKYINQYGDMIRSIEQLEEARIEGNDSEYESSDTNLHLRL